MPVKDKSLNSSIYLKIRKAKKLAALTENIGAISLLIKRSEKLHKAIHKCLVNWEKRAFWEKCTYYKSNAGSFIIET